MPLTLPQHRGTTQGRSWSSAIASSLSETHFFHFLSQFFLSIVFCFCFLADYTSFACAACFFICQVRIRITTLLTAIIVVVVSIAYAQWTAGPLLCFLLPHILTSTMYFSKLKQMAIDVLVTWEFRPLAVWVGPFCCYNRHFCWQWPHHPSSGCLSECLNRVLCSVTALASSILYPTLAAMQLYQIFFCFASWTTTQAHQVD